MSPGQGGARYHKRDFWADENLKYSEPHFRMRKVAREVRRIEEPVSFRGQTLDVIVAQGLFEYAGEFQAKLFAEVVALLNDGGRFVLTYQNFGHRKQEIYWPYSNVQQPGISAGN